MLGHYKKALAVAEQGYKEFPNRIQLLAYQAQAQAAMGKIKKVYELFEISQISNQTPPVIMRNVAEELLFRGYYDDAQAIFEHVASFYREQLKVNPTSRGGRQGYAMTLYRQGKLNEAQELYNELFAEFPGSSAYRLYLGSLAAQNNNHDIAHEHLDWFLAREGKYLYGSNTLNAARIAATLNEKERAIELIRASISQGIEYQGLRLHRDIHFSSLRDYPPFQDLMRPKG